MQHHRSEEVFDWAAYEDPQPTSTPAVYTPQPLIPAPARVRVLHDANGIAYYQPDPEPQPLPAYDPLPARMHGCGFMGFCWCAGLALVECGSWVFFKGLSMAEHAVVAISIAVALAAVAIVALKVAGGIRISNVKIGDNSSFSIGGRR
jgi:hypothetical protein